MDSSSDYYPIEDNLTWETIEKFLETLSIEQLSFLLGEIDRIIKKKFNITQYKNISNG